MLAQYNLRGLMEQDALMVARDKKEDARRKLDAARAEFDEWDREHARRLASWANNFLKR
jgi:acyl-CoA reductase-like NAD-dependent aldehyde dehydrogenase